MKKLILICMLFSSFLYANTSEDPLKDLSEEQRAEVMLQVAKMKKETPLVETLPDPEKINQYVEIGENIAKAAGAAAKELGYAADEFSQTNLGKITIALIAWKVMGDDAVALTNRIIKIVVLIPILFAFISLWVYLYRREFVIESVEWVKIEGVKKPKKNVEYRDNKYRGDSMFLYWIALLLPSAIMMGFMLVG